MGATAGGFVGATTGGFVGAATGGFVAATAGAPLATSNGGQSLNTADASAVVEHKVDDATQVFLLLHQVQPLPHALFAVTPGQNENSSAAGQPPAPWPDGICVGVGE